MNSIGTPSIFSWPGSVYPALNELGSLRHTLDKSLSSYHVGALTFLVPSELPILLFRKDMKTPPGGLYLVSSLQPTMVVSLISPVLRLPASWIEKLLLCPSLQLENSHCGLLSI